MRNVVIKILKEYLKTKPRLYDLFNSIDWCRKQSPSDIIFRELSIKHNNNVSFIQIGSNDGLRWDPVRKHIVNGKWKGVFVEPLPTAFEMLKNNYSYIKNPEFVFVNAAITSNHEDDLVFWTFTNEFLMSLSLEEKMFYLRLASFDKNQLISHLNRNLVYDDIITGTKVTSITINDLVKQYWAGKHVNLLVIDAEGHEASIIPSIDFNVLNPETIFFESHNLGINKEFVYSFLGNNGYEITEYEGDSAAIRMI